MAKVRSTGRNGPPKKPPHLHLISGTGRADRADPEVVKIADAVEPERPACLSADAIIEWDKVIVILRQSGLLSASDSAIIAAYCATKCTFQNAEIAIESANRGIKNAFGLLTLSHQKTPIQNPLIPIRNRALNDMTSYAIQLGLTPAARLRLNAEVSERKENPFDKLKNSD
jgi:P27 family predicted phage terminase small subunit